MSKGQGQQAPCPAKMVNAPTLVKPKVGQRPARPARTTEIGPPTTLPGLRPVPRNADARRKLAPKKQPLLNPNGIS